MKCSGSSEQDVPNSAKETGETFGTGNVKLW